MENPLLQDHLRERVRRLGYLSDTSFNQALVRLPLAAVSALAGEIIPAKEQERVRKALIKAGAPDGSFKAVLEGALKTLAKKVAGEAGDQVVGGIVDKVSDYLGPLFTGAADAVSAAGGLLHDADSSSLNLAAPVVDGQQIVVPTVGAVGLPPIDDGKVRLNSATAADLEAIAGVGPVLAARIVAYRESDGPFTEVEDLLDVVGIGESKLEAMRDQVIVP